MVFNEEFGVKERFVIRHMPLLLNRHVMDELVAKFADEVDLTTSHRFRHPHDLQLGMAYTSFVRESGEPYSPEALLRCVDDSGDGKIDSRKLDRLCSYLKPSLRTFRTASQLREVLDHCLQECSSNYSHPLTACSVALESCEPTLSKVIIFPKRIPKYLYVACSLLRVISCLTGPFLGIPSTLIRNRSRWCVCHQRPFQKTSSLHWAQSLYVLTMTSTMLMRNPTRS